MTRPHELPSAEVILSLLALGAICTAAAFVVFFALIAEVGPARATVITYVNPAVAVALGVLVLNEQLTPAVGGAFVLILGGSILATRPSTPAQPPATSASQASPASMADRATPAPSANRTSPATTADHATPATPIDRAPPTPPPTPAPPDPAAPLATSATAIADDGPGPTVRTGAAGRNGQPFSRVSRSVADGNPGPCRDPSPARPNRRRCCRW